MTPSVSASTQQASLSPELTLPWMAVIWRNDSGSLASYLNSATNWLTFIASWDMCLEDANGVSDKRELPVSGTFLVDSGATFRIAHVDVDYTNRLDPDDVIDALRRLQTA